MITLAGASSASSAALAGLQQAMLGAGHSIAALSSGEVPAPAAAPVGGVAPGEEVQSAPPAPTVGRLLNEQA
jgi:hypothetical protein